MSIGAQTEGSALKGTGRPLVKIGLVTWNSERHLPSRLQSLANLWQARPMGAKVLDGTGLFIDRRRHPYLRGHGEIDQGQYDKSEEVFGADGAAPLYRRKTLEDVTILKNESGRTFRRDWWRSLSHHLGILARVLVRDPSSLGPTVRCLRTGDW